MKQISSRALFQQFQWIKSPVAPYHFQRSQSPALTYFDLMK